MGHKEGDRITKEERKCFHDFLDDSIDKLNSPKNRKKPGWDGLTLFELAQMILIEQGELVLELNRSMINVKALESECYDIINCTLFFLDNIGRVGS